MKAEGDMGLAACPIAQGSSRSQKRGAAMNSLEKPQKVCGQFMESGGGDSQWLSRGASREHTSEWLS